MSGFLAKMTASSAERAAAARPPASGDLDKPVVPLAPAPFDVIAEVKGRSPAEGALAGDGFDRAAQASRYAAADVAAISVLTEPSRFDGSLGHLAEVVAAVPGTPVMRKDFLVDVVQVLEARAAGASGVLLIVAMLRDDVLRSMLDAAAEHGMFVLLEAFDAGDLGRAAALLTSADEERAARSQLLYGVNARDLRSLEVDPARLEALASSLPPGRAVAESGLHSAADAARVAGYGYSMALVGTALMRSADPATLIDEMKKAGALGLAA